MDAIAPKEAGLPVRLGLSAKTILIIAVLILFTILITWRARVVETTLEDESGEPTLVHKPAPDFSASTLDGRTVSLADFRGKKKVLVSFWASWCAPCRLEMPELTGFYRKNHTAASDFEILAVSIDDDPKDVTAFATEQKLNFPVLLDSRKKVADAYEVDGIPTMFIVDKDGKITYGHVGYDMAVQYRLTQELGIKDKKSTEGAMDGNSSH